MAESTLSRRISEFVGVALFALALIWLIALVTHEPTDPVWFFTTEAARAPAKFLGLVFGSADVAGKPFHAGGSIGTWLGIWLTDYLNRTGSIIVLLTLIMLAVILSTQFSFGRMFAGATISSRDYSARLVGWARGLIDRRRKARARREVIARQ